MEKEGGVMMSIKVIELDSTTTETLDFHVVKHRHWVIVKIYSNGSEGSAFILNEDEMKSIQDQVKGIEF